VIGHPPPPDEKPGPFPLLPPPFATGS
jgi:hypothetical protein